MAELLWCPNCEMVNSAAMIKTAQPRGRVGNTSRGIIQCIQCGETRDEVAYLRADPAGAISLNELEEVVGKTWALNLVDRSSVDQLVFLDLVQKGYSFEMAWQGMLATAPVTNNQGLHDEPMGPNPERTAHLGNRSTPDR